jgi:hypothetical protein
MHTSNEQVNNMWDRYTSDMATFVDELAIHRSVNRNDENTTRLHMYKYNLTGLRVGNWVMDTIIDFCA